MAMASATYSGFGAIWIDAATATAQSSQVREWSALLVGRTGSMAWPREVEGRRAALTAPPVLRTVRNRQRSSATRMLRSVPEGSPGGDGGSRCKSGADPQL